MFHDQENFTAAAKNGLSETGFRRRFVSQYLIDINIHFGNMINFLAIISKNYKRKIGNLSNKDMTLFNSFIE